MKVVKNIFIYTLPLLVWGVYLYMSPYHDTSYTLNLFDIILLFLLFPIGYGVYNSFSKTKQEWIIKSLAFVTIHALGCWFNDFIYIDIIYRPVDFFVPYLILIDIFILIISYSLKKVLSKNRQNNKL